MNNACVNENKFIISNNEENWLEQKNECAQYVIINVKLTVTPLSLHSVLTI